MTSPEGMRPYEMLPIPTDLEIVHITLLVGGNARWLPPESCGHDLALTVLHVLYSLDIGSGEDGRRGPWCRGDEGRRGS